MLRAPLWLAVPLAAFGFAAFGWGVLAFARERPVAPRLAIVVALMPVLGWVAALALSGGIPELGGAQLLLPLGIASAFELFIAAGLGRTLRSADEGRRRPAAGGTVLGVGAGALVAAALLLVALASAQSTGGSEELDLPTHHGDQ